MTSCALARGTFFFLCSLLALRTEARTSLSPQPGTAVERCTEEQVKNLFPAPAQPQPELRVLVTSFSGVGENAQVLGQSVGRRMRTVMETHAREQIKSDQTGLHADAIRVKFVPCTLDDHEHARKIGTGAQADVVLWGEAFCTSANPRVCQTTNININSGNVIQDSPGARIENKSGPVAVRVSDDGVAGRFTTSLTVVRWNGLEGNTAGGTHVRRFDQVAALGLPRLVSEEPRLLLNVVLGLYASRAGRRGLAADFFERAKKDVAASVAGAAELYRLIGTSYMTAGRKEQGLASLEAALRSCVSKETDCEATALHHLGWAKSLMGDKKTALAYYERALPLQQKVGDISGEAATLNNICGVYSALGDQKTALSYCERALLIWQKLDDVSGNARTLGSIGRIYEEQGDEETALLYYERALPLQQKVGDVLGEARTLSCIGAVYRAQGDMKTALSYCERALPLHKKAGDVLGEAATLGSVGVIYYSQGDQKTALSYLERALTLQQKGGDILGEAISLNRIGLVYNLLGDKKTALLYYERALPLQQKVGDVSAEGVTRGNLASTLRALGRIQESIRSLRDASSCYLRRSPPAMDEAIENLRLALSLAMRDRRTQEVSEISAQLDVLDRDELRKLVRQASVAGQIKSASATALYQRIAVKASMLPPKPQALLHAISQAGLLREQHRITWPDCPGVLITEVIPASQAEALGLRVNDIALRYQGACLFEPSDLAAEVGQTKLNQPITIEIWRDGAVQTVPAKGGQLGVALESF